MEVKRSAKRFKYFDRHLSRSSISNNDPFDMNTESKEIYDGFKILKKWNENIEIKISDHEINSTAAISELETLQMQIIGKIYHVILHVFHQIFDFCCLVMHVLLSIFCGKTSNSAILFLEIIVKWLWNSPK